MRIVKNELFKLFSNKVLLIMVAVLLLVNSFSLLFSGGKFGDDNYEIPDSAFRLMQADLSEISDEKRLEFIEEKIYEQQVYSALSQAERLPGNSDIMLYFSILSEEKAQEYIMNYTNAEAAYHYTDNVSSELRFLELILSQANEVYGYGAYLDEIQLQAQRMSAGVFFQAPDSFAVRNIQKTAQAYEKIQNRELSYNITQSVETASDNRIMDICVLLAVCFSAMILICGEHEIGAFFLLKTLKKGRSGLIICKAAALLVFCIASTTIFMADSFIISGIRFGFCDLNVPIQSVSGFIGCTLNISLWQYLLLFWPVKVCAYFVNAMLVFVISTISTSNIAVYAVSGGIIAVESALYIIIDDFSVFSPLKHLNIIALTDVNEIFGGYRNMNLIEYPVNIAFSSVMLIAILTTGLIFTAEIIFIRQQIRVYHYYSFSGFFSRINLLKIRISVSLFSHESYKLLITNKGIVVLFVMIIFSFMTYKNYRIMWDESDGYFRQYAENHGGAVTAETDIFLSEESLRFGHISESDGLSAELALRAKSGFDIFSERYNYAKENSTEIVYDTGWNILFSAKTTILQLMILFVFMSVMLAPVFSADSRIMPLINSTKKGRKQDTMIKGIVCVCITIIMFVLAHTPILCKICKFYGIDGLFAPVKSVLSLREFLLDIPLIWYLILRYMTLFLFSLVVMAIMLWISRKMKSPVVCTVLLLVVFAMPFAAAGVLI